MTDYTPLTMGRAKELLAQAVAEKPEGFFYTDHDGVRGSLAAVADCRYINQTGDGPDCIVGTVLHANGVSLDELYAKEGGPVSDLPRQWFADVETRNLLQSIQSYQDNGWTWAGAVRKGLADPGGRRVVPNWDDDVNGEDV